MAWQDVVVMELEPRSAGSPPTSPFSPGVPAPELPRTSAETTPAATAAEETPEEEAVKPDRRSSSSSSSSSSSRASSAGRMFHLDAGEMSTPFVAAEKPDEEHADAAAGGGAEAKPDDWASWLEEPAKAVDEPFLSDGGGTALAGPTQAPEAQTMAAPAPGAAPAADNGFNPERIPASIFQPKSSSSQAEWSIASNESLFSIHGASQSVDDLGGLYSSSRSHFDYFYDEVMAAAGGGGEPDWKLPPLAEGSEFAVPDSAGSDSDASAGSQAKKARAFRRHESGSIGTSSNFSFAFPILAETSPRKRESAGGYGYYKLQKEYLKPAPSPDPESAFDEMATEAERRRKMGWCWCGECCGYCWFDCSWSSCCSQWRWCCCSCSCSCPSFCRCNNWCL